MICPAIDLFYTCARAAVLEWLNSSLGGGARGKERTDLEQTNASELRTHFRFYQGRMKSLVLATELLG